MNAWINNAFEIMSTRSAKTALPGTSIEKKKQMLNKDDASLQQGEGKR